MKRVTLDFKNGKKVIESQSAVELINKLEQYDGEINNYGMHTVDDDIMEVLEDFKNNGNDVYYKDTQNDLYAQNSNFINTLLPLNNAIDNALECGFDYASPLLHIRAEIITDVLSDEETATAILEQNKIDNVKYEEVEDTED